VSQTLSQMIARARGAVPEISPAQAGEAFERGELDLILDVRESGEFRDRHVAGAISIPRGLLEMRADPASPVADAALTADRHARIVVYCTKAPGARSLLAAETLTNMGFDHVQVLGGGLTGWLQAGLAVEGEPQPTPA
jgi:rhodanese-related sulfurtransferase